MKHKTIINFNIELEIALRAFKLKTAYLLLWYNYFGVGNYLANIKGYTKIIYNYTQGNANDKVFSFTPSLILHIAKKGMHWWLTKLKEVVVWLQDTPEEVQQALYVDLINLKVKDRVLLIKHVKPIHQGYLIPERLFHKGVWLVRKIESKGVIVEYHTETDHIVLKAHYSQIKKIDPKIIYHI